MSAKMSASSSVEPDRDTERNLADGVDGVVEFQWRSGSNYRYQIVAKDDKLRIWLEDRATKKQWQTADLAMESFVTKDCVIPHSTFKDYVMCFVNCMESPLTSDDFSRELVPSKTEKDVWELRLTLNLRVFTATWTPTYTFQLLAVPLELVDLLAAKIRDQEDVIERLQGELGELKTKSETPTAPAPVYVRATAIKEVNTNQPLTWKADVAVDAIRFPPEGRIRFRVEGVFVLNITMQHTSYANGTSAFDIQLNGTKVQSCYGFSQSGGYTNTSVSYAFAAKALDEITVVYRGNGSANADSSLVIFQLR